MRQSPALAERLTKFKSYATPGEFFVRIQAIGALGVEDGLSQREFLFGAVVVTDDDVYAQLAGVCNLVEGLDATVQRNDQCDAQLRSEVNAGVKGELVLIIGGLTKQQAKEKG